MGGEIDGLIVWAENRDKITGQGKGEIDRALVIFLSLVMPADTRLAGGRAPLGRVIQGEALLQAGAVVFIPLDDMAAVVAHLFSVRGACRFLRRLYGFPPAVTDERETEFPGLRIFLVLARDDPDAIIGKIGPEVIGPVRRLPGLGKVP